MDSHTNTSTSFVLFASFVHKNVGLLALKVLVTTVDAVGHF